MVDDTASETPQTAEDLLRQHAYKAEEHYDKLMKQIKKGDKTMADILTMQPMNGNNDGLGMGGGLMGGLLLGALMRNGNGGLFGNGNGDGVVGAGGFSQPQANMSLMAGIGDIKQAVAVGTATIETSNAVQSAAMQGQLASVASAVTGQISVAKDASTQNSIALMQMLNGVNTNIMQGNNVLAATVTNDGEKTRALITQQYEATLNRQLSDANAAIIELRSNQNAFTAARGVEITTTNNINQMQAQQQQQQQFQALAGLVGNLANDLQYIRATNQAINIGAGTLTANPTNTNTNTRVN